MSAVKFDLAIVGLGYVGLPLGLQFAKSGCRVLGLDVDEAKVQEISAGRSYIRHISSEDVETQVKAGRISVSSDFSLVKDAEAVVICVPTPLNKNREPDISYILQTGEVIAPYLKTDSGRREAGGGRKVGRRWKAEGGKRSTSKNCGSAEWGGCAGKDSWKGGSGAEVFEAEGEGVEIS